MEFLSFAVSFALLVVSSCAASKLVARNSSERFWISLLLALLQIGVISTALSTAQAFSRGPFLLCQFAVACAVLLLRARVGRRSPHPEAVSGLDAAPPRAPDWVHLLLLLTAGTFVLVSGVEQWATPLAGIDELNYHASRACYWVQHASVFPFGSHNDRQALFPYLGELVFAWAIMFAKRELWGRLVFWLALPLAAAGVYSVGRTSRLGRRGSAAATLLYVSTPTVLDLAASLKPDSWQPVLLLGVAYFTINGWRVSPVRNLFLAGLMLGLAISVKTTAIMAAPALALVGLLADRARGVPQRISNISAAAAGGAVAIVCSGAVIVFGSNLVRYHHPIGPKAFLEVHASELSPHLVRVHAARVPLFLAELPELPTDAVRAAFEKAGRRVSGALGADERLHYEIDRGWPGHFEFTAPPVARRYALAGLIWLPALALGILWGGREARHRLAHLRHSAVTTLVLLQVPLFASVVFLIRWMGGGPERFWIGPFALSIPVAVFFARRLARRSALGACLCACLLAWQVYPCLKQRIAQDESVILAPRSPASLDGIFQEITPHIPPGSRILLIAGQSAPDYVLFAPRVRYPNSVVPWGKARFDSAEVGRRLDADRITHVVIEDPKAVGFHWAGGIPTKPFVDYLSSRADFTREVGPAEGPQLFSRRPSE